MTKNISESDIDTLKYKIKRIVEVLSTHDTQIIECEDFIEKLKLLLEPPYGQFLIKLNKSPFKRKQFFLFSLQRNVIINDGIIFDPKQNDTIFITVPGIYQVNFCANMYHATFNTQFKLTPVLDRKLLRDYQVVAQNPSSVSNTVSLSTAVKIKVSCASEDVPAQLQLLVRTITGPKLISPLRNSEALRGSIINLQKVASL
ncbi:MAG: hypothetical protein Harvfovirus6_3 [Harvfovirus sp.]|uniref:Uncharacterized protein n=1 Tax=Harvfovirus sp. TaxID=2487768 RepID=A0A3G5A4K2_9VIRU|nr:MAG: hypothetical protein Harvfovirus6_3 [Harvfovirus sp.]